MREPTWLCEQILSNGLIHVHPIEDLKDHDIKEDGTCWCNPDHEFEDDGEMIIHQSMDRREDYEGGRRKLS